MVNQLAWWWLGLRPWDIHVDDDGDGDYYDHGAFMLVDQPVDQPGDQPGDQPLDQPVYQAGDLEDWGLVTICAFYSSIRRLQSNLELIKISMT